MSATRELLAQIRDVLATLYLNPDMARMVAQDAGLDLRRVEYSNRPLENWEAILEEAQNQGRIAAILDIASRQYPEQADRYAGREAGSLLR
jgi:hypothetical protein